MKVVMTEKVFGIGTLIIFLGAGYAVGFYPAQQLDRIRPSDIARPRTPLENEGRQIYIENGCVYCHTQYIRPQDWDHGAVRVAQAGDYYYDYPQLLGAHRNGPDLSQEGGLRSPDWHIAHFTNPRYTRPASFMPEFKFLSKHQLDALVAYIQSLGGKMADARTKRMMTWRRALRKAYSLGVNRNFAYLHTLVPEQWRTLPNPYPADAGSLERGRFVYQQECVGCHGNFGDGNGPAAKYLDPKPANFSTLRRVGASGGLLYYQIMNGVTGTAMMSFKRELESAKIWDVSNYIAVNFIGHADSNTAPRGIDEVQEPVDPNAPGPPPISSVTVPPPTSAALQPDQNAIWRRHGPPTQGGPLAAPRGRGARELYHSPMGVIRR